MNHIVNSEFDKHVSNPRPYTKEELRENLIHHIYILLDIGIINQYHLKINWKVWGTAFYLLLTDVMLQFLVHINL